MDDGGRSLLGEHLKPTPKAATPARVRRIAASAYLLVAEADDLDELVGVQGGTADQGAVDVGLRHDLRDIARLHRAAVLDADLVGHLLGVQLGQPGADRRADLLGVVGAADLTGADGPDRLVRDHDRLGLLGRDVLETAVDLGERVRDVVARLPDVQLLADAQDRGQAMLESGLDLGVDDLVGLVVVLPALGVADRHVRALQLGQHRARDLAGVGTGVLRREVLSAVLDLELVAVDQGLYGAQVGEGRQDGDLTGLVVLVGQGEGEFLDVRDGLEVVEVHLPVARHQRRARAHLGQSSSAARPGSVLPSRYSREAPPPVEMWPNAFSSKPRVRTAAAESPPPTTVKPLESTSAWATALVPSA